MTTPLQFKASTRQFIVGLEDLHRTRALDPHLELREGWHSVRGRGDGQQRQAECDRDFESAAKHAQNRVLRSTHQGAIDESRCDFVIISDSVAIPFQSLVTNANAGNRSTSHAKRAS